MSTPQPGKNGGADVTLDEQGRIVINSPELAERFVGSGGNIPFDPPPQGHVVTNICPNLVRGCGSELAQ
ncbi:hypothetical protein ACIRYZ_18905 [Kitasatospora sp. NPDC101155]|uniref:hypothetical protein n=1 Tax=Kitasatospora sp. NPDC101155 TaxID=3364097 RepID=UPI0037FDA453